MKHNFVKMQALGNDFVIFDFRGITPIKFSLSGIKNISDRKFGVGCDQLILILDQKGYDCRMQIFNSDGSEVYACGNATRCVAKIIDKDYVTIKIGQRKIIATRKDGQFSVNMGAPNFLWQDIPLSYQSDPLDLHFVHPILNNGYAVNIGNPHVVFIVNTYNELDMQKIGSFFSSHPIFAQGANVNLVKIISRSELQLRVWERGSGETLACGSAACASTAVLCKLGLVDKEVVVLQPGGKIHISQVNHEIIMTGDSHYVFEGQLDLEKLINL